jgi:hypothetical protein
MLRAPRTEVEWWFALWQAFGIVALVVLLLLPERFVGDTEYRRWIFGVALALALVCGEIGVTLRHIGKAQGVIVDDIDTARQGAEDIISHMAAAATGTSEAIEKLATEFHDRHSGNQSVGAKGWRFPFTKRRRGR